MHKQFIIILIVLGLSAILKLTRKQEESISMASETQAQNASSIHPKDNFYLHVNQKWLNSNPIPPEYPSWGTFVMLHDQSVKHQIYLLKEIAAKEKSQRSEDEEKMALIWNKYIGCLESWDSENPDEVGKNPQNFQPLIQELQTLQSTFDDQAGSYVSNLANYFSYLQRYQFSIPLNFDRGSDFSNSNDMILDLAPSGLSLPSRDYYFDENFSKHREWFRAHLESVQQIISNAGIQLETDFVSKVFDFQTDLARIFLTQAQARRYKEFYTFTNLFKISNDIDTLNFLAEKLENYPESERQVNAYSEQERELLQEFINKFASNLGLDQVMPKNFQENYPDQSQESDRVFRVCVYDGDFFRRFFRLLFDAENRSKLRAYFQYNLIRKAMRVCTKALNDEFFDFYSRKLSGQQTQKTHEKRAVELVNACVGELLGKLYVARYFSEQSKLEVNSMIDTVLEVMRASLAKNDWLTSATKEKALVKLAKFSKKIGYPDKWKDYSSLTFSEDDSLFVLLRKVSDFTFRTDVLAKVNTVKDKTEWHMNPQTVNAYYSPTSNEIAFPAAILQPPFFYPLGSSLDFDVSELPGVDSRVAANFGAIAAVIAHEITHGFDDQGRDFDGDGNLANWWTEEDDKLFKQKSALMAKQAEKYEFKAIVEGEEKTYKQNADLTMGENLADLGGLSLSKQALQRHLGDTTPEILNGSLDVFFRSWTSCWKLNASDQYRIKLLTADPHAPAEFRGNLVANFPEFQSLYNITEGDRMYCAPEERVFMW